MYLQFGHKPVKGDLFLSTGGDFDVTVRRDGSPFPADATLTLHIGEDGNGPEWPFALDGDAAHVHVDHIVTDTIEARTPWRLIYSEGTDPSVETVIACGIVKRVV